MINLNSEQLGKLLFKAAAEPRRNQKRFLHDLGGEGSAEELDEVLRAAASDQAAVAVAERLQRERQEQAAKLESEVGGQLQEMLDAITSQMAAQGLTQGDVAQRCGLSQPAVSEYLSGRRQPGVVNLIKIAATLGCKWSLKKYTNEKV